MPESIDITLKRVAVVLADELDYLQAAEKLNIPTGVLKEKISALESQLYLHIFKPRQNKVELTEEGRFLVRVFREAVAKHDKIQHDNSRRPDS
ncbi:LysR family transcriptional regulator [Paracidobacterium acidisoli]|uniref:LysR family transcriptional regulator n=1 Tax=Paracidobacterium acidisoli TaxID=2303751 RepID=A0A372IT68_9BACT|nr:LysR family transcriptional regulator [Paracidobacterium acidisoli]MBT9329557.1 LysR family transcriptional regulator [Paracidobacterium acidisoli]